MNLICYLEIYLRAAIGCSTIQTPLEAPVSHWIPGFDTWLLPDSFPVSAESVR